MGQGLAIPGSDVGRGAGADRAVSLRHLARLLAREQDVLSQDPHALPGQILFAEMRLGDPPSMALVGAARATVASRPRFELLRRSAGTPAGTGEVRSWGVGREYSPHMRVSPAGDGAVASITNTRSLLVSALPYGEVRWRLDATNGSCLCWAHDGTAIATGGTDGSVTVWDSRTGARHGHWDAHGHSEVRAIAWGVEDRIVTTAGMDGSVKLWLMDARRPFGLPRLLHEMRSADGAKTFAVDWSSVGVLAAAGADSIVRLWRVTEGVQLAAEMKGHTGPVMALAWSPDGLRLASCAFDNTLRIWDPKTSSGALVVSNECDPMISVAWSPDGASLAYGADGYRLGIVETRTLGQRFLPGHENIILRLGWVGPDRLLSTSLDRRTMLWDTSEARADDGVGRRHTTPVGGASAFSHDGTRAASADYGVSMYDQTFQVKREHQCNLIIRRTSDGSPIPGEHQSYAFNGATGLAWSHDDTMIALCCRDGSAAIIDANTGRGLERWLASQGTQCMAIAWSPDDQLIATGSAGGAISTWKPLSNKGAVSKCRTPAPVWSLAWSPDGSSVAAGLEDGSAVRYDSRLKEQWSAHNHAGRVYAVAWLGFDGERDALTTCGADGQVVVCDAESGVPLTSHRSLLPIYATDKLGAGLLCSVGDRGVLEAWDPATGESVALLYLTSGASRLRVVDGSRVLVGLLESNAFETYDFEFIMPAGGPDLGEGRGRHVRCPSCNRGSNLQAGWLGSTPDCPHCGKPLRVNASEESGAQSKHQPGGLMGRLRRH